LSIWVLGLIWLAAVVVIYEDLLSALGFSLAGFLPDLTRQWLAFVALVLAWGFLMAIAAFRTFQAYRRNPHPLYRNQITYWIFTLILTTCGVLAFLVGYRGWGSLISLLACSGTAYLILAFHLPDARRVIREALSHLSVALLLVTFCAGGFLLGYYALQAVPGYPPWIVGGALALLLAILVHPLLDRLQIALAGRAPGGGLDASHIIGEYTVLISNLLDLDELSIVALGLAREAMETRDGAVYLIEDEAAAPGSAQHVHLRCVAGTGRKLLPLQLRSDGPVAEYLSREHQPLTQPDLDYQPRFQRTPIEERETLAGLGMDIYVPVHAEDEWIGLFTLGSKRSGRPHTEDDLELMEALAVQVGVALYNARRFETLRARLATRDMRNEELRAARQDLAQLYEGQSDLMRLAAREMQPSLSGIQGYVEALRELLRAGPLTAERGEDMMEGIASSTRRLREMTQTLSAAAIDSAPLTQDRQAVQVEPLIRAAAEHWSDALEARSLTFSTGNLDALPTIMADPGQLGQVFEELIQNAIKFTPDGGGIQVRGLLREGAGASHTVELVIADTGVGIAAGDRARIFEPYFRRGEVVLHGAGRTQFGAAGPGLGLSRVLTIVKAHGGRVWAESPGYDEDNCPGTEIHVVLPVRPGD
jgi:signal transduction histidine kinase